MKPLLSALTLAMALVTATGPAFSLSTTSITPPLTFPEDPPEPVTKDLDGIDK